MVKDHSDSERGNLLPHAPNVFVITGVKFVCMSE